MAARVEFRRVVATRPRRWLLGITLGLGLATVLLLVSGGSPSQRTYAALAGPMQSLMSVLVPFMAVLLVKDHRRLGPALATIAGYAAAVGAFGSTLCAIVLALAPATVADPWANALAIAVGGVLVQVVAGFVGGGLGLLIRSAVLADLATIVLPLGLWLLLGLLGPWREVRDWLVPYPSVQRLLAGEMTGLAWVQWSVVVLLWCVGLNAIGLARTRTAVTAPQ